ncbi:Cilia- and flagella-associated protein 91 [Clonorchis sinensis]|uniref:Cilia- and flagella-associated protein 91 n=2 Tax=Clonorchis sinensis TaxID=79923 RepID=A0A3R7H039_CLOSI|nr:Cilia- and flagella-associated protein 91 [Clonorchis sinensis]
MSQTQINVVQERLHDYLYDPIYTLSSERDHERVAKRARNRLGRLEKIFNFHNLFSEIPVYRPFEWKFSGRDPVPPSVARGFRPSDLCGELLKRKLKAAGVYHFEEDVAGFQRSKFFDHYITNVGRYAVDDPVQLDLTLDRMATGNLLLDRCGIPYVPTYTSKYVQTDYRDSEAQTDPYSPPYVVNVGETPEVLTLATLGYKKGLPAGIHDVDMIERARERHQIEASLEPYSQIASSPRKVEKRRKILREMELREWYYREKEVEALQEVRMKVLVQLLRKREINQEEIATRRLERMWTEQQAVNESRKKAIQKRYITALRKLVRRRLETQQQKNKRDVIKEYATPSSQAFAPLTRLGVFPDRGSQAFAVKNDYLTTYNGLLQLEATFSSSVLQPKIHIPPVKVFTKEGFLRREFRHLEELASLQKYLEGAFSTSSVQSRKPRFLEKIERPPPRPVTPTIISPTGDLALEREAAAVTLQKLLRGRAIQTQMFEGKEKRRELIAELRSTHALLEDDQAQRLREKLAILERQQKHQELVIEDAQIDDVLSNLECGSLAEMLDFLSKELDRLTEERRIHAMILLAERFRRMREAEESGTRQREERRRREQDEIFKQMVKVHQETVNGYLANVAGLALDSTAGKIAEAQVEEFAKNLDVVAHSLEGTRTELQSDSVAADMVYNFLIPEVNRQAHQAMLNERQRKFLAAAHREIWTPAHEAADTEPVLGQLESSKIHTAVMTGTAEDQENSQNPMS